jgi:hypothetical protein
MVAEVVGEDADDGHAVFLPKQHSKTFLENSEQTFAINNNTFVLRLTFHGRDVNHQKMAKLTFHP